jgi:hypothetical protein
MPYEGRQVTTPRLVSVTPGPNEHKILALRTAVARDRNNHFFYPQYETAIGLSREAHPVDLKPESALLLVRQHESELTHIGWIHWRRGTGSVTAERRLERREG